MLVFCPYQAAVSANLLKQMSGIFTTPFPAQPPYRKLIASLKRRTCSTHREQEMWSLKAAVTQSRCQEHCIAGLQLQATHADGGPSCGSPTGWPERTHQSRNNWWGWRDEDRWTFSRTKQGGAGWRGLKKFAHCPTFLVTLSAASI